MNYTPEEQERLAYIQGDTQTARLCAELQDMTELNEEQEAGVETQQDRIAALEEDLKDAKDLLRELIQSPELAEPEDAYTAALVRDARALTK